MNAFADAGPLMALGKLGQLDLLVQLYGEVNISPGRLYRQSLTGACGRALLS